MFERPPHAHYHLVLGLVGEELERFDMVYGSVPYYRVLALAETRLRQRERDKRQLAMMKARGPR